MAVLAFAILVPLQQFGIVTATTIVDSFLARWVVLPTLLALWTRYLAPARVLPVGPADPGEPAASAMDDD